MAYCTDGYFCGNSFSLIKVKSSEIRYDKFIEIVQKEKVKDVEIVPKSLVIDVSGTYSKKASNGKKNLLNSLLLFQEQKQN